MTTDQYDRPLMIWLSGSQYYLKSPLFIQHEGYSSKAACVAINRKFELHEVGTVELQPFDDTWDATLKYMTEACLILRKSRPGWAPNAKDAKTVVEKLGPPPIRCYALYFITISKGENERCVYVGQTNSKNHRFSGGHPAITKLHDPKYRTFSKQIYFAGVQVEDDDDHLFPIEWIHPEEVRTPILSSIEKRLIFELQPELNIQGKAKFRGKPDLPIATQNIMGGFLDACCFGPDRLVSD